MGATIYTRQAIYLHKKQLTLPRSMCDYLSSALHCVAQTKGNDMNQLKEMLEAYRNGERGLPTYDELAALAYPTCARDVLTDERGWSIWDKAYGSINMADATHSFVRSFAPEIAAQSAQVAVPVKSEARYQWLRDWFLRGGARLEIDPWGHVRVTTAQMVDEAIDAALVATSPEKESAA